MDKKEYKSAGFSNTEEQASEVRTWRGRYSSLISVLGKLGTEVRVNRTLEMDKDIAPHQFIRGAYHEFVFPPQKTKVKKDNSRLIDPTPGYSLRSEDVTRKFDADKVKGHIEVYYDDADSRITFSVTDLMDASELPDDVLAAVDKIEPAGSNPTA